MLKSCGVLSAVFLSSLINGETINVSVPVLLLSTSGPVLLLSIFGLVLFLCISGRYKAMAVIHVRIRVDTYICETTIGLSLNNPRFINSCGSALDSFLYIFSCISVNDCAISACNSVRRKGLGESSSASSLPFGKTALIIFRPLPNVLRIPYVDNSGSEYLIWVILSEDRCFNHLVFARSLYILAMESACRDTTIFVLFD